MVRGVILSWYNALPILFIYYKRLNALNWKFVLLCKYIEVLEIKTKLYVQAVLL